MPYWFLTEKKRVGKERDRRRKLTDEERETIKTLYKMGYSIRTIARMFKDKCTRRNIQFILFPERLKRQYEYKRERNWDYDRERQKIAMRKYRQHLKEIYGLKRSKNQKTNK